MEAILQIIVLCTYNGEKYLREQIQSLLTQDYSGELLLLLSDDGSTDGTREILQKTKEEYGEKIFLYDKGEASGSAWKHFLMILSALANQTIPNFPYEKMEYIFLSDQDDLCFPDKISALTEALQEAEKRYGKSCPLLCHSDMEVIDEGRKKIADSYFRYQKMPWKKDSFSNLLIQNHVTGAAIGMNQSLLAYLKKLPDFVYMHDQWIALLAAVFGHITVLPKALYAYRQHGNNVLGAKKGSAIKELEERLGTSAKEKAESDKRAEEGYFALFRQGREFRRLYGEELSEADRSVLDAFLSLERVSRIQQIKTMLQYKIYPLPFYRAIGAMLFLPKGEGEKG